MARILIDADGCPVVELCIAAARRHRAECLILCDTSHVFEREGAVTLSFSKGADSVDFALVNRVQPGDIVVTQDYGLAAMCLAKKARILRQDGMEYTEGNIGELLALRHMGQTLRRAGGRMKGPAKRTKAQDESFARALEELLKNTR